MAVNLSPFGGVGAQFLDNSGNVLTGGKIFTYSAGTTTNQVTYINSSGLTPHSNPIILDAAGRVPGGEIWLTDGLAYKFLLKNSDDVLIATYDNIIGINSNFVNFVNQQEIQTATAGQTVFNLTTTQYQPGTNSLSVFVDGVNQYGPGAQYAYLETDSDTVTFINGLHVGALVKFTTSQLNSSGATAASQVSFTGFNGQTGTVQDLAGDDGSDWIGFEQSGAGAVARSAQDKMRDIVSVKDFGAIGDGVADDTNAILAAKTYCIANLPITLYFPKGVYIYTEIGNWAYKGLTLEGAGKFATKLKCINASVQHTALLLNAFESGSPTDPFIDDCNVKYLTVEGNSDTLRVIRAQGISRSHWIDVDVRTADSTTGLGFVFQGCSINQFDNLSCVNYPADPMSSVPTVGLFLTNGLFW
jgi:hypothetical protein